MPIAHSLRGNLLRFAAPSYVQRLARGSLLVLIASLLWAFGWAVTLPIRAILAATGLDASDIVAVLLDATTLAAMFGGWWLLSSPDPAFVGVDDSRSWRARLRLLLPFAAAFLAANMAGPWIPSLQTVAFATTRPGLQFTGTYEELLRWAARLAHALVILAGTKYIAALSLRIPDARIRKGGTDVAAMLFVLLGLVALFVLSGVLARIWNALFALVATFFLAAIIVFLAWLVNYLMLLGRLRTAMAAQANLAARIHAVHTAATAQEADSIHPPPITQAGSEAS